MGIEKIEGLELRRLKLIRNSIEAGDKEFEENFFGRCLTEEEKELIFKKIFELEQKEKEEKIKKIIEEELKGIDLNNINNIPEEKIDIILENFENEFFSKNFLRMSEEKKIELKDKLLQQKILKNLSKENIQELLQSVKTKTNFYHLVAQHIIDKYYFNNLIFDEIENTFYAFSPEGWREETPLEIKKIIKTILGEEYNIKNSAEILENIKVLSKNPKKIALPLDLLPLKNGIFSLSQKTLYPYSADYFIKEKEKLNVFYDPSATCPEIENFINEVADDEQTAKLLFEIIAYTLYRENPHQKAFFLIGSGANGKSTFISLLEAFLGTKNISSIPFQALEKNRFILANLMGKYANLFADLPRDSLSSVSFFKALTGEDVISAEKKFVQKTIEFRNFAKLIFSANQFPKVYDDNNAFFRRIIVVNFNKKFIGEKADPNKLKKITTREELSGLFNVCVDILPKILESGFSYAQDIESIKKEYIKKSNSIAYFIEEQIEEEKANSLTAEELYRFYVDFCEKQKISAETHTYFGRYFLSECASQGLIVKKKRTSQGIIFQGISIKKSEQIQTSLV